MELPEEDRPPEDIWLDPEALDGHFKMVRARWAEKSGGGGETVESRPMDENELAKEWRRG